MPGTPDDPLRLGHRRRLHELVAACPGLHLRELARRAGLEPNHAKYHLLYLQRRDLVSSRRTDGYWRFWPRSVSPTGLREDVPAEHKEVLRHLRRPVPGRVCRILLEEAELAHHELRARLDLAHSTLHHHMQRMVASGIVATERCGRERRYRLQDADLVARTIQLYPDALGEDVAVQGGPGVPVVQVMPTAERAVESPLEQALSQQALAPPGLAGEAVATNVGTWAPATHRPGTPAVGAPDPQTGARPLVEAPEAPSSPADGTEVSEAPASAPFPGPPSPPFPPPLPSGDADEDADEDAGDDADEAGADGAGLPNGKRPGGVRAGEDASSDAFGASQP